MAEDENSKIASANQPYGKVRPLFPRPNSQTTKSKQEQSLAGAQVSEDDDDPGPAAA